MDAQSQVLPGCEELLETKRCARCKEVKPLTEFSPGHPTTRDGRDTRCKKCKCDIARLRNRGRASADGWVYFILDGWGNIKIGSTSDIANRLTGLQSANSSKLVLLAKERGGKRRELELQDHFHYLGLNPDRYVGSREWFSPGEELVGYIDDIAWAQERWSMPSSGDC